MSKVTLGKWVIDLLACPHEWSEGREVMASSKKEKPRPATHRTCKRCGGHKVTYADGMSDLVAADDMEAA